MTSVLRALKSGVVAAPAGQASEHSRCSTAAAVLAVVQRAVALGAIHDGSNEGLGWCMCQERARAVWTLVPGVSGLAVVSRGLRQFVSCGGSALGWSISRLHEPEQQGHAEGWGCPTIQPMRRQSRASDRFVGSGFGVCFQRFSLGGRGLWVDVRLAGVRSGHRGDAATWRGTQPGPRAAGLGLWSG